MPNIPTQFSNVTVLAKANVYFDGKVVSHTIIFDNGEKKTLGLIYPGTFHFGTGAPERMEIVSGSCKVVIDGAPAGSAKSHMEGGHFDVPGKSGFSIEVTGGICEYVCSYLV